MPYLVILLFLCGMSTSLASPIISADTVDTQKDYLATAKQLEAQEKPTEAIHYYELAKSYFMQEEDDLALVPVLHRLAALYSSDTATQVQAERYLDSAQLVLEKSLPKNDTLHANTWYTRAELALAQRKFDEAIEYYQKSLARKKAFYGENHWEVAEALESIGSVYLYGLQNPYESEQYHKQALRIREWLGDQSRLLINCRYHLVEANRLRGDFEEALAYGFEVLKAYERAEEDKFYFYNMVAATNLLGIVYYGMGDIEEALNYNRKAIALAIEGSLLQSINMPALYNNQAEYHSKLEAYDSTIYYARLSMMKQPEPTDLANSYQFLGNAYWGEGLLDLAFQNYQESKKLKEAIFDGYHTQLATLYVDMGRAFATNQQVDSALHYYEEALASAKISYQDTISDIELSIQAGDDLTSMQEALTGMTNVLVDQYEQTHDSRYLERALPYFQLFDRFMDLSRASFSTEGAKLLLSGNHKVTYERAIASCYQLYQATKADSLLQLVYHFMEKSKAIVLLESIHQAEQYQSALPDSLIQQDQSLRARLAYLQSELIDAEQHITDPASVSDWQRRKADVLSKLERLNQHIRANYPNYYDVTYRSLTIQLDSLQTYIPAYQPTISYFWGDSAVYAMLIKSNDIKMHRVKDVAALKKAVDGYREVLINDAVADPSYSNFLQYQENAHTLYQLLLEPLLLDDTLKHLTIVPDGDLTTIPFESLITSPIETKENDIRYEKLPYLIKSYDVSYEFSLSVAFVEKQYTDVVLNDNEVTVTAFGIRDFANLPGHQQYPDLGGAEQEVIHVQEKFSQAQVFLNAEATEAKFKRQAPSADILHIATHGMVNLENPFASKFIFYPGEEEDGILHLYELYNMPLKAQLLLLSACESGVGKYYAGEGNFSLARSFVYAGCKSVLMSLWQVKDNVTERMIKGIYDQLAQQSTIGEAVRHTKLAFIEEEVYAHPQCWAGMVPLGDTSIKFSKPYVGKYINAVFVASGLSVIFIVWLFLRTRTYRVFKPGFALSDLLPHKGQH